MTSSTDTTLSRAVDPLQRSAAAASEPVRGGVRDGLVVVYVLASLAALAPGLIGWLAGPVGDTVLPGGWHERLLRDLVDIKFGSGLRFWLGVAGAGMMGVMLLYPLRKLFAQRFRLGRVGGWFHIHILLGLIGPVLILYHCNFSFGGFNANVALVTMLVVVVSGVIGHFVYARVSASFYGDKVQARAHLDGAITALRSLDGLHPTRIALIERLEAFEAQVLAPRRGVISSIVGRLTIEVRRRQFFREAAWIVTEIAREQAWTKGRFEDVRRSLGHHLGAYFATARRAAGRSIREQLWARWRLFHLPLFLIMSVAAGLHVYAVWGVDDAPREEAALAEPMATASELANAAPAKSSRGDRLDTASPASTTTGAARPASAASSESDVATRRVRSIAVPLNPSGTVAAAVQVAPSAPAPAPQAAKPGSASPTLVAAPEPASRRPVARPPAVAAAPREADWRSDVRPSPAAPPRIAKAAEPAEPLRPSPMQPEMSASSAGPKPADSTALYSELQRRTGTQPMALGGAIEGRTLSEQIATLKANRFDHATTKFPLTGKHTRVDCASCHKTVLKGTPTACVACHKKDDVHRGRRPVCASCHTTNRWSEIKR